MSDTPENRIIVGSMLYLYSFLALLCGACELLLSCSSPMQRAGAAEAAGQWRVALEMYAAVVDRSVSDKFSYPNKTNPLWATEDDWIAQLTSYLNWTKNTTVRFKEPYHTALQGICRCTSNIAELTMVLQGKSVPLSRDTLSQVWFSGFSRNSRESPQKHRQLIDRLFADSVSFLMLRCQSGFSYTIGFLNVATGARLDLTLYPQSSIPLLVTAGTYLLFCESEVTVTDGLSQAKWNSGLEALPLTIPAGRFIHRAMLRTEVPKNR
ncbi:MAG: hypothetical protein JW795_11805 [Chitinivibrionales bacterium]|nr:hypothetical protein [Chitinivibrionales bacterium]